MRLPFDRTGESSGGARGVADSLRRGFTAFFRGPAATQYGSVVRAEFDPADLEKPESERPRALGTFGGVFTPSFLTIIGVIMYLRFSWVVANAGLWQTILIVVIANSVTFITGLSISSIASNERMETGGAYFMVSRVMGYHAGGGIGIPLYLSQALSVAFYVIGFAEALNALAPAWPIRLIGLVTLGVLTFVALVGTGFMIRIQYLILAVIVLSFVSIGFGFRLAYGNYEAAYQTGQSFWSVFAVFFPAVTGILAGVSMSGDLKDPARAIPKGTMWAITAGFIVYLSVPIMLAFTVPREALPASDALRLYSRWPALVTAGVFGATLSSAIGSLMGAPRTLQALAYDGIVPRFFGAGVGRTQEPLVATALSLALSVAVMFLGSLNAVASVLTMFFLTTYGVLNLSAAIERMVGNPSFRPAVRVPWWVSFFGAVECIAVMVLIDPTATVVALVAISLIFLYLNMRKSSPAVHGGVWEGVWTRLFFSVSRRLTQSRSGSGKNWRPLIQVFAAETESHAELIRLAARLTQSGGALATYALSRSGPADESARMRVMQSQLRAFVSRLGHSHITTTCISAERLQEGVVVASQAAGFGAGSYNTVMLGLPQNPRNDRDNTVMLARLTAIGRNVLLFRRGIHDLEASGGPIVVWWGGQENNVRLMLILAYLLQGTYRYPPAIRLATIVAQQEQVEAAQRRLKATLQHLRLQAETTVVVNTDQLPVHSLLATQSDGARIVLLGMAKPNHERDRDYLKRLRETAAGLDAVLFVLNNIEALEYV